MTKKENLQSNQSDYSNKPSIVNLTNFSATETQKTDGVFDLPQDKQKDLKSALLFKGLPDQETILAHAKQIAELASQSGAKEAMIAGAPYLMGPLENALKEEGVKPLYSFSERVSQEIQNEDGTVTKKNVFEHKGFVEPPKDISVTPEDKTVSRPGIVNLTQHNATPEQVAAGVIEPENKETVKKALTFIGQATPDQISEKAKELADIAAKSGCKQAMIGGAPYLMGTLEKALAQKGIESNYAFSERQVISVTENGITKNESVFKFQGFIKSTTPVPENQRNITELSQKDILKEVAKQENCNVNRLSIDDQNVVTRTIMTPTGDTLDVVLGKYEDGKLDRTYEPDKEVTKEAAEFTEAEMDRTEGLDEQDSFDSQDL